MELDSKTIVRVKKDRENPYVMINKRVFEDERISWKAKGLIGYLLSKPDNWEISLADLVKRSKDGKDSVLAGLRELRAAGYVEYTQGRNERGQLQKPVYTVYEEPQQLILQVSINKPANTVSKKEKSPQPENPVAVQDSPKLPQPDFPHTDKPHTGNPTQVINDSSNNKEITNDRKQQQNAVVAIDTKNFAEEVSKTIGEHVDPNSLSKLLNEPGITKERVQANAKYVAQKNDANWASKAAILFSAVRGDWARKMPQSIDSRFDRAAQTWTAPSERYSAFSPN